MQTKYLNACFTLEGVANIIILRIVKAIYLNAKDNYTYNYEQLRWSSSNPNFIQNIFMYIPRMTGMYHLSDGSERLGPFKVCCMA